MILAFDPELENRMNTITTNEGPGRSELFDIAIRLLVEISPDARRHVASILASRDEARDRSIEMLNDAITLASILGRR